VEPRYSGSHAQGFVPGEVLRDWGACHQELVSGVGRNTAQTAPSPPDSVLDASVSNGPA